MLTAKIGPLCGTSPRYVFVLKEFIHVILDYFDHVQNYLYIEGNRKIVINVDRKTPKR